MEKTYNPHAIEQHWYNTKTGTLISSIGVQGYLALRLINSQFRHYFFRFQLELELELELAIFQMDL